MAVPPPPPWGSPIASRVTALIDSPELYTVQQKQTLIVELL